MKAIIDYKELENFLSYLEDKTDDVYEREVQQAIKGGGIRAFIGN